MLNTPCFLSICQEAGMIDGGLVCDCIVGVRCLVGVQKYLYKTPVQARNKITPSVIFT